MIFVGVGPVAEFRFRISLEASKQVRWRRHPLQQHRWRMLGFGRILQPGSGFMIGFFLKRLKGYIGYIRILDRIARAGKQRLQFLFASDNLRRTIFSQTSRGRLLLFAGWNPDAGAMDSRLWQRRQGEDVTILWPHWVALTACCCSLKDDLQRIPKKSQKIGLDFHGLQTIEIVWSCLIHHYPHNIHSD